MKINKVNTWIYWILMLLPFLMWFGYMLYGVLTRTGTISNPLIYFGESWTAIIGGGNFDWLEATPFFQSISDFTAIFTADSFYFSYIFTYMITISVAYLGIEVLMWFINFARKLMYKVMGD